MPDAMKRTGFKSESELVAFTGDWLRADGWACFFECAPWGSGAPRADIVATKGPLLAVIECKMSLSLALLEQCKTWTKFAHVVWGATPTGKRSQFACELATTVGCGLVQFDNRFGYRESRIILHPQFRRRVDHEKVRRHLGEAQATTAPGAGAGYSTPFRETCTQLRCLVRTSGGRIAVKDAMAHLQHHYRSASSARSNLIGHADAGVIEGVRVVREGRAVFFEEARS